MGSGEADPGHAPNQAPRHRVRIARPFLMGKFPVTQAQYAAVVGTNPSKNKVAWFFGRSDYPVESVSWKDAQDFCSRLDTSMAQGWRARLPSEAEWEFACRAGVEAGCANNGGSLSARDANFGELEGGTTPVGKYPPNAWGLYDMHGNVWEWCEDDWHADYVGAPGDGRAWCAVERHRLRVVRGGSWYSYGDSCQSSTRCHYASFARYNILGFRVAVDLGRD